VAAKSLPGQAGLNFWLAFGVTYEAEGHPPVCGIQFSPFIAYACETGSFDSPGDGSRLNENFPCPVPNLLLAVPLPAAHWIELRWTFF
jgi:hypothetical protein